MKKFLTKQRAAFGLALVLSAGSLLGVFASAASPSYSDVSTTHWAYDAIVRVSEEGLMKGTGGNRFEPDRAVSAAEFATMIARAFWSPSLENYEAAAWLSDAWWRPGVTTVFDQHGFTMSNYYAYYAREGYQWTGEALEHLTGPMSRYEMALMVWNTMREKDCSFGTDEEIQAAWDSFGNIYDVVPTNYITATTSTIAAGILNGRPEGFAGDASMTRAEAATVLVRMLDYPVPDETGDGLAPVAPENTPQPTPTQTPAPTPTVTPTPTPTPTVTPTPTPTPTSTPVVIEKVPTPASQVNAINPVGKSDEYPTYGGAYYFGNDPSYQAAGKEGKLDFDGIVANAQKLSNNGYRTGANIQISNKFVCPKLCYEQLDMVNELRAEKGLPPYHWVTSDAAEEYTLRRAFELAVNFSHDREGGDLCGSANIAKGYLSSEAVVAGWADSPGHYAAIVDDYEKAQAVCAARFGTFWVITFWNEEFRYKNVEWFATWDYSENPLYEN